jgi:hypothetical protein
MNFKNMPLSVKLCAAFLLVFYITACIMAPVIWLSFGLALAVVLSTGRIVKYLVHGE